MLFKGILWFVESLVLTLTQIISPQINAKRTQHQRRIKNTLKQITKTGFTKICCNNVPLSAGKVTYSSDKLSTGLPNAAFKALNPTVTAVIKSETTITKTYKPIGTEV